MPWQVTARAREGLIFLNNSPLRAEEAMALGRALATAAVSVRGWQDEQRRREAEAAAAAVSNSVVLETLPSFPSFEPVPLAPTTQPRYPGAEAGDVPRNAARSPYAPEQSTAHTFGADHAEG